MCPPSEREPRLEGPRFANTRAGRGTGFNSIGLIRTRALERVRNVARRVSRLGFSVGVRYLSISRGIESSRRISTRFTGFDSTTGGSADTRGGGGGGSNDPRGDTCRLAPGTARYWIREQMHEAIRVIYTLRVAIRKPNPFANVIRALAMQIGNQSSEPSSLFSPIVFPNPLNSSAKQSRQSVSIRFSEREPVDSFFFFIIITSSETRHVVITQVTRDNDL